MSWKSEIVKVTDPPAVVQWFEDTPVCTDEKCPQYDGKRCRALGFRPDRFCEPVVAEMTRRLDAQESVGIREGNRRRESLAKAWRRFTRL